MNVFPRTKSSRPECVGDFIPTCFDVLNATPLSKLFNFVIVPPEPLRQGRFENEVSAKLGTMRVTLVQQGFHYCRSPTPNRAQKEKQVGFP